MGLTKIKIDSTQNTPEVILDPGGLIRISGRAMSVFSPSFIEVLDTWLEKYIKSPAEVTKFVAELDYLNRSNINAYAAILKKTASLKLQNQKVIFYWIYENGDEDMRETGELLSSMSKLPFNFIVREEDNDQDNVRSKKKSVTVSPDKITAAALMI